jgi:hypothetical protein
MSTKHHFTPRGSGPLIRRNPRDCILMATRPIAAALQSVRGNRAILDIMTPIAVGTRVELLHPEAGIIPANVVSTIGSRVALAFNGGNRGFSFALQALSRSLKRD